MPTAIEWCDETFNPWWGCAEVSPGCAHCYARTWARFTRGKLQLWPEHGQPSPEHGIAVVKDAEWRKPLGWARELPERLGRRPRIFCASMADVFEERPELDEHRVRLMMLIERTPELDWLILTKRPEFARDWLTRWYDAVDRGNFPPGTRAERPYRNVWLGVSIENPRYTWRADVLREIPAAVRFISAEPLLGSLFTVPRIAPSPDAPAKRGYAPLDLAGIGWIIIGGESGPGARPFHLEHARELIRATQSHADQFGISPAVFVKQLGARPSIPDPVDGDHGLRLDLHLRDRKGGDIIEFPADLQIREFPRSAA